MHPLIDGFYKGRAKLKKGTGDYFDSYDKAPKKACFIGAMYYGIYNEPIANPSFALYRDYPLLRDRIVPVPCKHVKDTIDDEGTVLAILIHLNDAHSTKEWPDAKIVEWLEKILAE